MSVLKIRIEGLPEDIKRFIANFRDHYSVLAESKPYKNRNSEYVRVYVEIGKK